MTLPKPNRDQLAFSVATVIVLAVMGALVWGFGRQLALARQMRAEEIRLEQAVAAEQARHDELTAQLEYVKSDEYVEHWARAEAKMAKPGEVVVVLAADTESVAAPQPTPSPEPEARPFWVEWWELAFGAVGQP
ncbi:MAG: hypothetical protein DRJ03_26175 [Chloroflexi bacterium]|nr:MAG: hypothetical protein DRJ03_26175 [Chloroflexota bacterium]HEY72947.1 septum formation initiator family protein [Thermoflexia bacterium]